MGSTSVEELPGHYALGGSCSQEGSSGFACAGSVWPGHRQANLGWKEMRLTCSSNQNLMLYGCARH